MKYARVREMSAAHAITTLCRCLELSRSGYYDWRDRGASAHERTDHTLLPLVLQAAARCRGIYGDKKTWLHLRSQGHSIGKHRTARLRRQAGLEAKRKRRFRITVEHRHTPEAAPDLLERKFTASEPDRVWVGDMTFIRTRQGWLHLTMRLDLFSRRVVGWAMSERHDGALYERALNMAIGQRRPAPGLIHHTDRGTMYSTKAYRELIHGMGMRQSMNGRKSAYDNAVAESFFSNLKNELVHHCQFATRELAMASIFEYIELFYNRQRIHQSLGYVAPAQFEAMHRVA